MDGALRVIDRGAVLDAARHALELHQWLVAPDFDQEGDAAGREMPGRIARHPAARRSSRPRQWIDGDGHGGARPPIRSALVRFWVKQRLLRAPVPLTGARACRPTHPGTRRPGYRPSSPRWPTKPSGRWTCCSPWSAPGSLRAPRSPAGAASRAPPSRWTSWPRPPGLRQLTRRRARHGSEERRRPAGGLLRCWHRRRGHPSLEACAVASPVWRRCAPPCGHRIGPIRPAVAAGHASTGPRIRPTASCHCCQRPR